MKALYEGDLYCGFASLPPLPEPLDFGEGIVLAPTYAHLMLPRLMAFTPPPPKSHHPGPWRSVKGSAGIDIRAQLTIPEAFSSDDKKSLAFLIANLFRLYVNPHVTLTVFASAPFAQLGRMTDAESILLEVDTFHRVIRFGKSNADITSGPIRWIVDHWRRVFDLSKTNGSLSFALDCLDSVHYSHTPAAALLTIWSAIEALFSPSRAELAFRVSMNVATFLERPGEKRLALQKKVAKLYGARSAVTHGSIEIDWDAIAGSYEILRRAIIKIIELGKVPSAEALISELLCPIDDEGTKTDSNQPSGYARVTAPELFTKRP